jgi:hypothetical protein
MIVRRFKRKTRQRGLSHIATTLEAAMIMGGLAVLVAGQKRLDSAITARRAVEISAQDSATSAAAECQGKASEQWLGEIGATSKMNFASVDLLGLPNGALPVTQPLGISHPQAFHAQQTPLRHTTSLGLSTRTQAHDNADGTTTEEVHTVASQRQLSCQDIPQPTTTPDARIRSLRSPLWTRNLMGY